VEAFVACFEDLEDPRTGNAGLHDLPEILLIALCTVLSSGQAAVDMAISAREKQALLRELLKLEHGLPSHNTFSRVFRLLDPEQFRGCFQRFMARFAEKCQGTLP
jgi:DDE_Tnp_1-associated